MKTIGNRTLKNKVSEEEPAFGAGEFIFAAFHQDHKREGKQHGNLFSLTMLYSNIFKTFPEFKH
jgi:hypothetical protein